MTFSRNKWFNRNYISRGREKVSMPEPSDYENKVLEEIRAWKYPDRNWMDEASLRFNEYLEAAGEKIINLPVIRWVVPKVVGALLTNLNDLAHWSIRRGAVYQDFTDTGHRVTQRGEIFDLDLSVIDGLIKGLKTKYVGLAATEGAATGLAGVFGIPADITALVTLNQRAVAEYAAYCGFDTNAREERLFALCILDMATSGNDSALCLTVNQLAKIGKALTISRTSKDITQTAFVGLLQRFAKVLGIRLTKAKAAQIVPAVGAGVAAGFNGYYTKQVCETAYFLYRERFLAEKYGPGIMAFTTDTEDESPNILDLFEEISSKDR